MKTSPEHKLLVAIHSDEVFAGRTIRQELPWCCNKAIDLFQSPVKFRDVRIGLKTFSLLAPQCPICGKWHQPEFSILN